MTLVLLFVAFQIGCSESDVRSGNLSAPALYVVSSKKDVGLLRSGQMRSVEFVVKNLSDSHLTVQHGIPSCNCSSVTLSSRDIAPNSDVKLEIEMKNEGRVGGVASSSVSVFTKGTVDWSHEFEVCGTYEGIKFSTHQTIIKGSPEIVTIDGEIYSDSIEGLSSPAYNLDEISAKRGMARIDHVEVLEAIRISDGVWQGKVRIMLKLDYSRLKEQANLVGSENAFIGVSITAKSDQFVNHFTLPLLVILE